MVGIAAIVGVGTAASAVAKQRSSPRVADDYFGVNYPLMHRDSDEVRERQLDAIAAAGITDVRRAISWRNLQPFAPLSGTAEYVWRRSDDEVEALAEHGLRMQPAFLLTPRWAESAAAFTNPLPCTLSGRPTVGTESIAEYAAAARALAERYGAGGSFWQEHPELPQRPIETWEIWNEQNSTAFWCPKPDPAAYAELFAHAALQIKQVQPAARVISGGLVLGAAEQGDLHAHPFLALAVAQRPDLWSLADGIGIHAYPGEPMVQQLGYIIEFREALHEAGIPDSEPMYLTEIGWSLTGPAGMPEEIRAKRYRYFMRRAPRLNCNLAAVVAHAWTTSPAGGMVHDGDAGIADRVTAELTPSALAYSDTIALMRGRERREAPHAPLRACAGMPELDRDADGVAEHRDYYPLNPRKAKGPKGW